MYIRRTRWDIEERWSHLKFLIADTRSHAVNICIRVHNVIPMYSVLACPVIEASTCAVMQFNFTLKLSCLMPMLLDQWAAWILYILCVCENVVVGALLHPTILYYAIPIIAKQNYGIHMHMDRKRNEAVAEDGIDRRMIYVQRASCTQSERMWVNMCEGMQCTALCRWFCVGLTHTCYPWRWCGCFVATLTDW